jgi:AcrR family transcriptional regulator
MGFVKKSEPTSRTYRSALREEQAERTRLLIARAARRRFIDSGWVGTSVRSVAAEAGVSEATVYAVYGSKAGLAVSLVDSADADADTKRTIAQIEAAEGDPRAQLAAFVGFERRLFEHGGDGLRVIVEGRRNEPALADAYAEGRGRGDGIRREVFGSWPASAWRKGMTLDKALDVFALFCSIDTYDVATRERGWSPDELERWWVATLSELLLA